MLMAIRGLRVLLGVIAAWQAIGLLPTLTWLPHLDAVTTEMGAGAALKVLVLAACVAGYRWLGRVKSRNGAQAEKLSDAHLVGVVLAVGVCALILVGYMAAPNREPVSVSTATVEQTPKARENLAAMAEEPVAISQPHVARFWTQESTTSAEIGPWLNYDPPGTRYCRLQSGEIERVYPPSVRPDLPRASPHCVLESVDRASLR